MPRWRSRSGSLGSVIYNIDMADLHDTYPRLRLIDTKPIDYEGARYLLLRDPLGLNEDTLLVPQPLIPLLAMCDGTRNPAAIRGALAIRFGLFLSVQRIEEFLRTLDEALLLDNDRSRRARASAAVAFRQSSFRQPASAGASYPEDPGELAQYLQGYLDTANGKASPSNKLVRGIVSPHIDYERGGPVYAQVWGQATRSVKDADLAIIFGTDHYSEGYPISLTRQNYATPFGTLPTNTAIVDELADVLGTEEAYAGELHHRKEHSIELAAVWMHYIRDRKPIELVPILTGSLDTGGRKVEQSRIEAFLDVLQRAMQRRRVLVVAAGDLAHVGPAFDTEPVNQAYLANLKAADDELIAEMCAGDAQGFIQAIQRVQDRNNVCGVSPIYLTLRLLGPLRGQNQGYAVCPADTTNTSVVTICGVTLQ